MVVVVVVVLLPSVSVVVELAVDVVESATASATADNARGFATTQGQIAGNAAGSLAGSVKPGMEIQSLKGETIGTVRKVNTDAKGAVQSILVDVDGRAATLPAGNFSANGDALVSGMTEGQIKKASKEQAAAASDAG